jgi:hypothetical protein
MSTRPTRRDVAPQVLFGAVAAMIGLAAAFVVSAEIVLRILDRPARVTIGWTYSRAAERNEFGFRGHPFKPSAGVRLVLLGDSQVESNATTFEEMPEVYLRRAIIERTGATVSIATIGASGWGQDQQLLALQTHINAIRPLAVVLWFTEGNDLWNNTFPTNLPKDGVPKPTFWLEGGELRGPHLPWLEPYVPPGFRLVHAIRRVGGLRNYPTDAEWELRLPPPYRSSVPPPGTPSLARVIAQARGVREDEVPYFAEENFETEKTHFSVFLAQESPRLNYSAALTRALLSRIQSLCAAHGATLLLLVTNRLDTIKIPPNPTMFEVRGKGYTLSSSSAHRVIDRVLQGFPVIRLTAPPRFFKSKTDSHFTGEGNRWAMESMGRELAELVERHRPDSHGESH